jgi:glutathione S-transferase
MSLKLHVFPPSPRAFKVLAVAEYLGLDYELRMVDFTKGTHKTPEFTALNPNQKMPVMEDGSFVLWEANAITQYLAAKRPESGLLPADPARRALVNQWQCWDLAHWEAASAMLVFENLVKALFNLGPPDAAKVAEGEEKFHRVAGILDGHLKKGSFIVGDAPTVADFSIGAVLNATREARLPVQGYPNIVRWHEVMMNLPGWRKAMSLPQQKAAA